MTMGASAWAQRRIGRGASGPERIGTVSEETMSQEQAGETPMSAPSYAVIVLAGGRSRRMGGADKLELSLGSRTLLGGCLASVREAFPQAVIAVAGPERPSALTLRTPPSPPIPAAAGGPVPLRLPIPRRPAARQDTQQSAPPPGTPAHSTSPHSAPHDAQPHSTQPHDTRPHGTGRGASDHPALDTGAAPHAGGLSVPGTNAPSRSASGQMRKSDSPQVRWCREEPAGGGPAPGIAAGVGALTDEIPALDAVLVCAGDMPRAGEALAAVASALGQAPLEIDAVLASDGERWQPLCAAWRPESLARALRLAGAPLAGRPVRALLDHARIQAVPVAPELLADIDTPGDYAAHRVRRR
ncbi:hypothetical protein GCM10027079_05060 [Sediminivirga luteola]|uniref:MobA-like NTP transferase domain-containing protein n=3 Tax=Sediminivirga luteola TaxID=1774748 RepID=A0A8J2TXS2_9MICO|nr:hypothetical protein GCM10011333_14040 [Sediminivirga luteola]